MNSRFDFVGIPSGDGESFCWDVSEEEYKRITGENPSKGNESFFNKGFYRLYDWDMPIPSIYPDVKVPLKVSILINNMGDKQHTIIETEVVDGP